MRFARYAQCPWIMSLGPGGWAARLLCFVTLESPGHRVKSALYCLGVAFESALAPAKVAVFVGNLDEKPAGKHTEVLDGLDFGHVELAWDVRGDGGLLSMMTRRWSGIVSRYTRGSPVNTPGGCSWQPSTSTPPSVRPLSTLSSSFLPHPKCHLYIPWLRCLCFNRGDCPFPLFISPGLFSSRSPGRGLLLSPDCENAPG